MLLFDIAHKRKMTPKQLKYNTSFDNILLFYDFKNFTIMKHFYKIYSL